ncbi:MAG: division plane positioning ATPase MipZ [Alphaproteobacteria bacterium]
MSHPGSVSGPARATGRTKVVVLGNEKGGTGKSTTAMHLIIGAMREGARVGSIDLDSGQASLSRYIANRREFADENGVALIMPEHHRLVLSQDDSRSRAGDEDKGRLIREIKRLSQANDIVFIDTPGGDTDIGRTAIRFADTLVTPINDSLIDLDLIARLEGDPPEPVGPSRFSEKVWEARKERASDGLGPIDWVVLRNRVSTLASRNRQAIEAALDELSGRFGFRVATGFGERVVFRELFLQGLTVLDLRESGTNVPLNMSHIAARREVRRLLEFIGLVDFGDELEQAASS